MSVATSLVLSLLVGFLLFDSGEESSASVRVRLQEPDVRTWLDDVELPGGSTTLGPTPVKPGDHTVRVMRGRQTLFSGSVAVGDGQRGDVSATWKPRGVDEPGGDLLSAESGQRFRGHKGDVTALAFSGDGRYVVSAGADNTVRVWDAELGRETHRLGRKLGRVLAVTAGPDGRVTTLGDDATARVWGIATGDLLDQVETHSFLPMRCAALSAGGRLAAFGAEHSEVRVWDLESNRELRRISIAPSAPGGLAFSPDGRSLLVGVIGDQRVASEVQVVDLATGDVRTRFRGHEGPVWSVAFLPDGRRAVSAGSDRTLRLWDADTGREIKRFDDHPGVVRCLTLSADGRFALAGTGHLWSSGWLPAPAYVLQVWDLAEGRGLGRFETSEPVDLVALSPDGSQVLAAGEGQVIRSWKLPPRPSVSVTRPEAARPS